MSIRRIESAYATFLDDKRLSGTEMSVLVALAYVANEKRDEDCFPSDGWLAGLTHLSGATVRNARNKLRSRKIIDWISGGLGRQGGNISNRYRFLFPHCKMPSKRDRYQPLDGSPTPSPSVPTPSPSVPCATSKRTLRRQIATNTEGTPKRTSESNTEDRGVVPLSDFEFKFEPGVVDKSLAGREQKSVVDEAMRVCGVDGPENKRTFTSVMLTKNPSDCLEAIMTFESEIRQGEHTKAKNLAAILTRRLKALP